MSAPDVDPYKVLQVDPEAEDEVIQAAYRRLAQKYHPDRSPGPDAVDRMLAINAAWALVGDPGRRAAYDRQRGAPTAAPVSTVPSADNPYTGPTRTTSPARPPETVSADWTSGRNSAGGGYDPSMQAPD